MPEPRPADPYAAPRRVESPEGCFFYHTTDVPGHGLFEGQWDLRPGIDAYLGGVNVGGKRVLDMGAASGFLSFHLESAGAEVVSYDLSEEHSWDIVPYSGLDLAAMDRERRQHLRAINDAYWLCHTARGSRARMVHGTVYTVPDAIGPVDATVFGAILLHVRDPFLALHNGARLARETVVVTEFLPPKYRLWRWLGGRFGVPQMLLPRYGKREPVDGWWILPPPTTTEFLGILGFEVSALTFHTQLFRGEKRPLYTIVARRVGPTSPLM
jgi:hypothetical protein